MKTIEKSRIIFAVLGLLFLILTGAETPESWSFTAFLAYHVGMLLLCVLCFYFAGKRRKPKKHFTYVIAPEWCASYLTPCKKYEVIGDISYVSDNLGFSFYCISDIRGECHTTSKKSTHLDGKDWIIPEINQFPEGWTKKQKKECILKAGIVENRDGYVRRLDEPEQSYEGETSSFSTNDFQCRSNEQLSGSYKIGAICFVAIVVLLVIAVIIK